MLHIAEFDMFPHFEQLINTCSNVRILQVFKVLWLLYIYIYIKVKVKLSRYRPGVAQKLGRGIALLFHDRGTRSV